MSDIPVTRLTPAQALQTKTAFFRLLLPFRLGVDGFTPAGGPMIVPAGWAPDEEPAGDGVFQLLIRLDSPFLSPALFHRLETLPAPLLPECSPLLMQWLMDTMLFIEEMQASDDPSAVQGCHLLACTALHLLLPEAPDDLPARHTGRTAPGALVEETIHYVEAHFSESLSLSRIAGHLFVTPSYLSRLFHRCTGKTFSAFLQETRLEKARTLLTDSPLSITEIAAATGLGTASHLGALFRRAYGASPNAYRRSAAKNRYFRREEAIPR